MLLKSRRLALPLLAIGAVLVACGGGSDTDSIPNELDAAVAYQLDAAHSGFSSIVSPNFPAAPSWQWTFFGNASSSIQPSVSYPLIAGGKVFVLTSQGSPGEGSGAQLYALDVENAAIAWGPIDLGGDGQSPGHAYDQGKIFVVNSDGLLQSFDASTGAPGWRTALPNQRVFTTPPTASGGKVYVVGAGSGTTIYAVDEVSGSIIWQVPGTVDGGSPTIGPDGLFLASPCQTYGFDLASGSQTWRADLGCIGGDGRTVAYASQRVYARDYDPVSQEPLIYVRNEKTGALISTFRGAATTVSAPIPAVSGGAVYVLNAGTLQRLDPTLQNVAWSFTGDGTLSSAPIVVGPFVVVGAASGQLYALDSASGVQRWSSQLPTGMTAAEYSSPATGLAVAQGFLIVPAGNTLTAWRITGP